MVIGPLQLIRQATPGQRRTLLAAAMGWALDAFDAMLYSLVLALLMRDLGMSKTIAGTLGTLTLLASGIGGILFGFLADRIGRKPVMIGFCLLGALTALGAIYFQGSTLALGVLLFAGWLASGAFPLFMGVIPGESIPRKYAATAMGLVVCVGEVLGGSGLVALAGKMADLTQLSTAVLMMAGSGMLGTVLCLFLVETAPAKSRSAAVRSI